MAKEEQTLANLFKDAGYRTHAIGKWHLGDEPGYTPTDRGLDTFFGVPYSDDMQPLPLIHDTTTLEADTDRDELTPRYTEEALKILDTAGDHPFFLYCAYSYPHDPARGSKAFRGRSQFGDVGDSIEEIDWSVGKLLDSLERAVRQRTRSSSSPAIMAPGFKAHREKREAGKARHLNAECVSHFLFAGQEIFLLLPSVKNGSGI